MKLGPYTLVLQSADTKPEQNYTAQRMIVEVLKGNKQLMMMYPEKRAVPGCGAGFGHDGRNLFHAARRRLCGVCRD